MSLRGVGASQYRLLWLSCALPNHFDVRSTLWLIKGHAQTGANCSSLLAVIVLLSRTGEYGQNVFACPGACEAGGSGLWRPRWFAGV